MPVLPMQTRWRHIGQISKVRSTKVRSRQKGQIRAQDSKIEPLPLRADHCAEGQVGIVEALISALARFATRIDETWRTSRDQVMWVRLGVRGHRCGAMWGCGRSYLAYLWTVIIVPWSQHRGRGPRQNGHRVTTNSGGPPEHLPLRHLALSRSIQPLGKTQLRA